MDTWKFKQYDLDSHHIDIVGYIPSKKNTSKDDQNSNSSNNLQEKPSLWSELSQEQRDYYNRQRSGFRTKSKVRRSIIKYNMRYMWTLTFKSKIITDKKGNVKDAGDVKDVWKIWNAFLKRCSRKGLTFKYIVVLEVQEKRLKKYGEKVYHFHFCTNKFIHHSKKTAHKFYKYTKATDEKVDLSINMSDLWGHGFVYATSFKNDTKMSAAGYLTKYVTKSFEEIEEKGVQRYRISEGLTVESYEREETMEIEMDAVVEKLAREKNCFHKKEYHLIDGHNEILVYTICPKSKKKKNASLQGVDQQKPITKKRWKSLENRDNIKLSNGKGEKEKCQSTLNSLQIKLF